MKSVRFRSYSGPHFPAFGLNTDQNNSENEHFLGKAIFAVKFSLLSQYLLTIRSRDAVKNLWWNFFVKILKGFVKKLHHTCLKGSYIPLWVTFKSMTSNLFPKRNYYHQLKKSGAVFLDLQAQIVHTLINFPEVLML